MINQIPCKPFHFPFCKTKYILVQEEMLLDLERDINNNNNMHLG